MPFTKRRPPVSTRYAFALAFDLVRRDALQSLLIPFLLRAPWAGTLALLPPVDSSDRPALLYAIASVALLGDFLTLLLTSSMLRIRARSVFQQPKDTPPAPAAECYRQGAQRVPWLFLTEVMRNAFIGLAASFSIVSASTVRLHFATFFRDLAASFLWLVVAVCMLIPTFFLGFRLAVATEAIVLDERTMVDAIQRSFRMMEGRFERWFELITATAALVIWLAILASLIGVGFHLSDSLSLAVFWLLVIALTPLIQYAWTFFYLRLKEVDAPAVSPESALAAHAPSGPPA